MTKITIIVITFFIMQSSWATSFRDLQKIPHDSANFENMRIWFPVEKDRSQVKINILDSQNKQVRFMMKQVVTKGYYNIYWDKKNTDGEYVKEGIYKVAIIAGDFKRIEDIHVQYTDGENLVIVSTSPDLKNPYISLKLLADSLRVSLEIVNAKKNHTDSLFVDSLIVGDSVKFDWNPVSVISTGRYYYKLQVNDFEHLIEFRYKK